MYECNRDQENDRRVYILPHHETIYFSALDTNLLGAGAAPDYHTMNMNTTASSSGTSGSDSNYYTPLRRGGGEDDCLNDDDENAYTSLRYVHFNNDNHDADDEREEEEATSSSTVTSSVATSKSSASSIVDTQNDSVIAAYAQLEEFEKVGRRSLDYARYCEYLERIELIIFDSFEKKVKTKKIKHYNIDQTIEETLDETNYENVLDELIKKMAVQNSMEQTNTKVASPPSQHNCCYTGCSSTPSLTYRKHPIQYVIDDDGRKSKTEKACQTTETHNTETKRATRTKQRAYECHELSILHECSSEYPLLEHAFNLARRCDSFAAWHRFICDEHYPKFIVLAHHSSCHVVRSVTSIK